MCNNAVVSSGGDDDNEKGSEKLHTVAPSKIGGENRPRAFPIFLSTSNKT